MSKTTTIPIELGVAGYLDVDGKKVLLLTNGFTLEGEAGFAEVFIEYANKHGSHLPEYEKVDGKYVRVTEEEGDGCPKV